MTEILSQGELNAKAELALMGRVVQILDRDNMEYVLDYIADTLKFHTQLAVDIYNKATRYTDPKETVPVGLSCSTLLGGEFRVVNIIFKDKGKSLKLDDPDGVLCYVHNFDAPDLSELGYCFFERQGSTYHRIG